MLEDYLCLSGGGEYLPDTGAVYIPWSSTARKTLEIGGTHDQLESEVRGLDRSPRSPHRRRVLSAWLVHDVDEAGDAVAAKGADGFQGCTEYKIRLNDAKAAIQEILDVTANTVLSPLHGGRLRTTGGSISEGVMPLT
jgi:hypothetical protein